MEGLRSGYLFLQALGPVAGLCKLSLETTGILLVLLLQDSRLALQVSASLLQHTQGTGQLHTVLARAVPKQMFKTKRIKHTRLLGKAALCNKTLLIDLQSRIKLLLIVIKPASRSLHCICTAEKTV